MRVLETFAGIGGFALAWERLGFEHVAMVEIDPFCQAVLRKHWPEVPIHGDIKTFSGLSLRGRVDILTGGPPCQPASVAGKRKGVEDARWLWPEFLRVVREALPRWVVAENPPGIVNLRPHGLEWIIGELEGAGYEVLPVIVGADDVGAPHRRKRVWIVAHRPRDGQRGEPEAERADGERAGASGDEGVAYRLSDPIRELEQRVPGGRAGAVRDAGQAEPGGDGAEGVAHRDLDGRESERVCGVPDGGSPLGYDPDGRGERAVGDGVGEGLAERHGKRGDGGEELEAAERAGCAAGVGDAQHDAGRADEPWRGEEGRASVGGTGQIGAVDHPDSEGPRDPGEGAAWSREPREGQRDHRASGDPGGTRWPARPGEPQFDFEPPRLSLFSLGRDFDEFSAWMDRLDVGSESHYPMGYGKIQTPDAHQVLPTLRSEARAEDVRLDAGGYGGLQAEEVLQPRVLRAEEEPPTDDEDQDLPTGGTHHPAGEDLPAVRIDGVARASSRRSEPAEQRPLECGHALCLMSREGALGEREDPQQAACLVRRLRSTIESPGALPEALAAIRQVWRSASDEEKHVIWMEAGPSLERRLRHHNRDALKALGNACVPTCVEVIGRAILAVERSER